MNGISSWTGTLTPQEIARLPWNAGVAPAGTAFDLPGRAALDFQEATGADPRKFREEMELTLAGLKGLPGDVPEQEVKAIESDYANAIPRFIQIALAGGDVQEAESLLFDGPRNRAKSLVAEHKYRQPTVHVDKLTSWERNVNLYRQQLAAIDQAASPEEKSLLEEQASLTKAWLDKQGKFSPAKASETFVETVRGVESPEGITTNTTHRITRPITQAGTATKTNTIPKILSIRRR